MNELKPIYEVLTEAIEFQEIALELLLQYDKLANFKVSISMLSIKINLFTKKKFNNKKKKKKAISKKLLKYNNHLLYI